MIRKCLKPGDNENSNHNSSDPIVIIMLKQKKIIREKHASMPGAEHLQEDGVQGSPPQNPQELCPLLQRRGRWGEPRG